MHFLKNTNRDRVIISSMIEEMREISDQEIG